LAGEQDGPDSTGRATRPGADAPHADPVLALTGERTMPGVASENYWFRRHEAAYRSLQADIHGGLLIDIGAGEGYGTTLLADRADRAVAIDYDRASITHLAATYPALAAVQANLAAIPIRSGAAGTVASLQVIEHVWDHPQFVAECVRVLAPGGLLIVTTPNRLTFSPGLDRPVNPFHTHEFTARELSSLIANHRLGIIGVRGLYAGPRLVELDAYHARAGRESFVAAQLAAPPADWAPELAEQVASVTVEDFEVREDAEDDCLDLILLARRP
jgi:SAM-dependent methyltransferase